MLYCPGEFGRGPVPFTAVPPEVKVPWVGKATIDHVPVSPASNWVSCDKSIVIAVLYVTVSVDDWTTGTASTLSSVIDIETACPAELPPLSVPSKVTSIVSLPSPIELSARTVTVNESVVPPVKSKLPVKAGLPTKSADCTPDIVYPIVLPDCVAVAVTVIIVCELSLAVETLELIEYVVWAACEPVASACAWIVSPELEYPPGTVMSTVYVLSPLA